LDIPKTQKARPVGHAWIVDFSTLTILLYHIAIGIFARFAVQNEIYISFACMELANRAILSIDRAGRRRVDRHNLFPSWHYDLGTLPESFIRGIGVGVGRNPSADAGSTHGAQLAPVVPAPRLEIDFFVFDPLTFNRMSLDP